MKRIFALVLIGMMMLAALAAAEPAQAPTFEDFAGLEWMFTSGAGAWYTTLEIGADGTFTGSFHDSEMGDAGDDFPYGSVYGCLFHGRMTMGEQVNAYTWSVHVDELELDEDQVPEAIEEGIRYVTSEPYGIKAGIDMQLYLPGTPVSELPEDFLFWAHLIGEEAEALPYYGLYDVEGDAGFVGVMAQEDNQVG